MELPPAVDVTDGPYELRTLQAPVLRGWALRVFIWLFESPLGRLLYPILAKQSGVTQVLLGLRLPEHPRFVPDVDPIPGTRRERHSATLSYITPGPGDEVQRVADNVARAMARGFLPHLRQLEAKPEGVAPHGGRAQSFTGGPTVVDFARAYRDGSTSPTEVAERIIAFLEAGAARTPPLHWMVGFRPDLVRQQAEESTRRIRDGTARSVLEGVPFAVKDVADALPYITGAGTTFLAAERPVKADAPYVAVLRVMGALCLGKTSLHEIGLGVTGLNPLCGTALNPHALQHYTGGSSSGSAAVVAAGLCPIAIGSDGGGSIRIPASFCGCVGLKPTAGLVGGQGVVEVDCTVATMGPLATCTQDAALLHAVMGHFGIGDAGKEGEGEEGAAGSRTPADPDSPAQPGGSSGKAKPQAKPAGPALVAPYLALPNPWPQPEPAGPAGGESWQPLAGLRIGVYGAWFDDAAPEVVAACRAALARLEGAGAAVEPVALPELEHLRVAHTVTIVAEMAHNFRQRIECSRQRAVFNSDVRLALANARFWTPADYVQAQRVRARASIHFRRVLRQVHLIATPTTPHTAPRIHPAAVRGNESNLQQTSRVMRFVVAANMVGLPAVSVPCGWSATEEGPSANARLPIGLQLIGRPFHEATLLRAAAVLEAVLGVDSAQPIGGCYLNPLTGEQRMVMY